MLLSDSSRLKRLWKQSLLNCQHFSPQRYCSIVPSTRTKDLELDQTSKTTASSKQTSVNKVVFESAQATHSILLFAVTENRAQNKLISNFRQTQFNYPSCQRQDDTSPPRLPRNQTRDGTRMSWNQCERIISSTSGSLSYHSLQSLLGVLHTVQRERARRLTPDCQTVKLRRRPSRLEWMWIPGRHVGRLHSFTANSPAQRSESANAGLEIQLLMSTIKDFSGYVQIFLVSFCSRLHLNTTVFNNRKPWYLWVHSIRIVPHVANH